MAALVGAGQVAFSAPATYYASVLAITASLMLAGIALGLGTALRSRRLRMFGQEELLQSIINAALLGSLAAIILVIDSLAASAMPAQTIDCKLAGAAGFASCSFSKLQSELFSLASASLDSSYIIGFVSSTQIDFGSLKVSQFSGLSPSIASLGSFSQQFYLLSSLAGASVMVLGFAADAAMGVFLPVGLLLRSFFITRRIGGAIIAIAICAYVFYPLSSLVGFSPQVWSSLSDANASFSNFSGKYASIPAIDLSKPDSLREMISDLSKGDFTGDVSAIQKSSAMAISAATASTCVYPSLALAICAIAFLELSKFLGSELGPGIFEIT